MLLRPVKFFDIVGSAARVRLSPRTADCTGLEYIWPFWRTTIIPLLEELAEEGNWVSITFWATCDSALVGPPKLEPATLYDTELKKTGIWVPATMTAIIHATIMSLWRLLKKELKASNLERGNLFAGRKT